MLHTKRIMHVSACQIHNMSEESSSPITAAALTIEINQQKHSNYNHLVYVCVFACVCACLCACSCLSLCFPPKQFAFLHALTEIVRKKSNLFIEIPYWFLLKILTNTSCTACVVHK